MIKNLLILSTISGMLFGCKGKNVGRNNEPLRQYTNKQIRDSITVRVAKAMSLATSAAEKDIYKINYGVDSLSIVTEKEALRQRYEIIKAELQSSTSGESKAIKLADSLLKAIPEANATQKNHYRAYAFTEFTQNGHKEKLGTITFFQPNFDYMR